MTVPTAPRGWLKATKDEWTGFFGSEIARTLDDTTLPGLLRLFEMRDLQRRAWTEYRKRPFVDGSQGQPVANPAFANAMALERAVQALEDRYGLSLKAVAALGVTVGQAKLTAAELNRLASDPEGGDDDAIEVEGWEAV